MAFIIPSPRPGLDYRPGQFLFTCTPDSTLSRSIGLETARAAWESNAIVATHVALITSPDEIVEAWWPHWRRSSLLARLSARDVLCWPKTPKGQTPQAEWKTIQLAQGWVDSGMGYDEGAIAGFVLSDGDDCDPAPYWLEESDAMTCSEGAVQLLLQTEYLRTVSLPTEFKAIHPSRISPQGLLSSNIWE